MAVGVVAVLGASLTVGSSGVVPLGEALRGALAAVGLAAPLDGGLQVIVELRLWRALTGLGVGAALALSGALLQGVFRNDLASPSILGLTTGATVGASLAILLLGGYGPAFLEEQVGAHTPWIVGPAAFLGALAVTVLVTTAASSGGRLSVPNLLLLGIAANTTLGGLLAAIQTLMLRDYDVARALFAWSFGTLDDRSPAHVAAIAVGVLLAGAAVPFVHRELDLLAAGEEDAEALGVPVQRVRVVAILAATLAAGLAVSVAGQIAFVGLVVPHLLRLIGARAHGSLLPLCLLGGPLFLLGTDFAQRLWLGDAALQPGVLMSIVGGPLFFALLLRDRRRLRSW